MARLNKLATAAIVAVVAVIAAGVVAGAAYIASPSALVLRDAYNKKFIAAFSLDDAASFSVSFIHSVNKTEVTETYRRNAREIELVSCKYYGFGAGVLTELEYGQSLEYDDDGAMIITDINTVIPHLIYRVGTAYDHILAIGGSRYSLTDLCGQSRPVAFSIEKCPGGIKWNRNLRLTQQKF